MFRLFFTLILLALPAASGAGTGTGTGETVIAGLSQNRVSITANFDGTGILIFGAVKRDSPPPPGGPLEVIIAVSGPSGPLIVRRKDRVLGIWINRASLKVDAAPSFYAIESSVPLKQAISATEDLRYKISIPSMIRSVGAPKDIKDAKSFSQAVIRIRENNGLYSQSAGSVKLTDNTLFSAQFRLPSNLVEGDYKARIFLTRDREVVDSYETAITVRKVGLERWIYNLAHKRPLIYGLLSLVIAIGAGWLAAAVFRLLRIS